MLFVGRQYSLYRNMLFRRFAGARATPLKSLAIDSLANVTFEVPLYLGLLAWGGVSLHQMLVAAMTILVAPPYRVDPTGCSSAFGAAARVQSRT